jgi:hypothetical protein
MKSSSINGMILTAAFSETIFLKQKWIGLLKMTVYPFYLKL